MKLFNCPQCREIIFFENSQCIACGTGVGYLPETGEFEAIDLVAEVGAPERAKPRVWRVCGNRAVYGACNWLLSDGDQETFCVACRLNEIIPDLANAQARAGWLRLEVAKRRLVYTLRFLGLPVARRKSPSEKGLAFAFMSDGGPDSKVMTGHKDGLITINVAEADDANRERLRGRLGEPYRTVLGHFRHEIGHFYWDYLINNGGRLDEFRALFGDETLDYTQALQRHYEVGPPIDWASRYVSAYASSHPWEDWAETWAHYLHMVDGVETARAYRISLHVEGLRVLTPKVVIAQGPSDVVFDELLGTWMPVTLALNSFTRGMGLSDAYPFALSAPVIDKLRFVHAVVTQVGGGTV